MVGLHTFVAELNRFWEFTVMVRRSTNKGRKWSTTSVNLSGGAQMGKSAARITVLCLLALGSVIGPGAAQTPTTPAAGEQAVLPAPRPPADATRDARTKQPRKNTNRIVGGVLSNGFPFLAALLYEDGGRFFQYCGASVIADRWLLTAAHCDVQKGETAIINRADLSRVGGVTLKVILVRNHPQYDTATKDNDISLVQLSASVSAAIPRVVLETPPGVGDVTAAGWGATEEGGKPDLRLREVIVPIVGYAQCVASYPTLTENMLCAGDANKDSCQGDSGGPLFNVRDGAPQQFGVTSFGRGCGRQGFPGVYTRVDRYVEWIKTVLAQ